MKKPLVCLGIDLQLRMLPFDGLSNLIQSGYKLFFFSKNLSLLEIQLEAFASYLELRFGPRRSLRMWKNVIKVIADPLPGGICILKRKSEFLLQIFERGEVQSFCLLPRNENLDKAPLKGELGFFKKESDSFLSVGEAFFDTLLSPRGFSKEVFFLGLLLHKFLLLELDRMASSLGGSSKNLIESLHDRGFLLSLNKKNYRSLHDCISDSELSSWLFRSFRVLPHKARLLPSSDFNEKLILLQLKVLFTVFQGLLLKKGYCSTFREAETYLSHVFLLERKQGFLLDFVNEIGSRKLFYLIWQFFPNYLTLVCDMEKYDGFISREAQGFSSGEKEQSLLGD